MAKLTLTDPSAGYNSTTVIAANNALVEAAVENTLSRDGTAPNQMQSSLDMNSNSIVNLPNATNNSEPVTLGQAASIQSFTGVVATSGSIGAVLYPLTAAETSASVTPTDYTYPAGHVLRYGANTTPGTTDMTTAIQNALNSNNDVYLPSGTYYIGDATLVMPANTTLRGDGEHSLITTDASTKSTSHTDNIINVLLDNVVIKDIAINGDRNDAGNQFDGIYIDDDAQDISILNVTFIDHGAAIWMAFCDRVLIDGCRFLFDLKNKTGIVGQANEVTDTIKNVTITNNYFGKSWSEAIDCQSYCTQWVISNNHFYDNCNGEDGEVIDIGGEGGINNNIVIDGNMCENNSACRSFVWVKQGTNHVTISNNVIKDLKADSAGGAFSLGYCRDIAVVGNTVEACSRVAYLRTGGTGPTTDTRSQRIVISGNIGVDLGIDGVEVLASNTETVWGLSICDNHFHTTTGTGDGISVLSGIDVTISGNTVDGFTGNGIEVDNTTTSVTIFTITGNVVRACTGDGIYIKADRGTVSGNVCDGNTGWGLNVGGASDYVVVTGNLFYNNTAGEITGLTNLTLASSVQGNSPPFGVVYTLADDGTPYVGMSGLYKTGGTTTITDFDFGVVGQTITILAEHAITITDNAAIILNGSADFVMASGDTLTLTMFNDQIWQEVSRTVN